MDGDAQVPRPTGSLKSRLAGLVFGRKLAHMITDATRDEFTPEGAPSLDERSFAVWEAANALAADEDWDDDSAVAELLRLAGRHHDALHKAEVQSRQGGYFLDYPVDNRAQRLLEAAVAGRAVRATTDDEQRRFALVSEFAEMEDDAAWAFLTERVPALGAVLERAKQRPGLPPSFYGQRIRDADARQRLSDEVEWERMLGRELAGLLGPQSGDHDLLVGSASARTFAERYIQSQRQSS